MTYVEPHLVPKDVPLIVKFSVEFKIIFLYCYIVLYNKALMQHIIESNSYNFKRETIPC